MIAGFCAFLVYLFLFLVVFNKVYETWVLLTDQEKWYIIYGGFD